MEGAVAQAVELCNASLAGRLCDCSGCRRCFACRSTEVFAGRPGLDSERRWVLLLCRECTRHPQVRARLGASVDGLLRTRWRCAACSRKSTFGPEGAPPREARFCLRHRPSEAFRDLISPRCQHPVCIKRPVFGAQLGAPAFFCRAHCPPGFVDVMNRRCATAGCPKHPSWGFRADGTVRACGEHRAEGMHDLRHRRCRNPEGCERRAMFGDRVGGVPLACLRHREAGQVPPARAPARPAAPAAGEFRRLGWRGGRAGRPAGPGGG